MASLTDPCGKEKGKARGMESPVYGFEDGVVTPERFLRWLRVKSCRWEKAARSVPGCDLSGGLSVE